VRGTNASNNGLALSLFLDYEERFRERLNVPIFRIVDQKKFFFVQKLSQNHFSNHCKFQIELRKLPQKSQPHNRNLEKRGTLRSTQGLTT